MSFILSTDSCCDIAKTELRARGIRYINFSFSYEEKGETKILEDNFQTDADVLDFYKLLRTGVFPKTTQIGIQAHYDYFKSILEGDTDILHVCLSSGISGTYNSALAAARQIKEDFGVNVYVHDTKTGTIGQRQLLDDAEGFRAQGKTAEETLALLDGERGHIQQWLMINDLMHLKKGGRLSVTVALLGTIIGIKPVVYITEPGGIKIREKTRGQKKAVVRLADKMKEFHADLSRPVIIAHTDADELCEELRAEVLKYFPEADIRKHIIGPIIGSHLGPGAIALQFFGDHKEKIEAEKPHFTLPPLPFLGHRNKAGEESSEENKKDE